METPSWLNKAYKATLTHYRRRGKNYSNNAALPTAGIGNWGMSQLLDPQIPLKTVAGWSSSSNLMSGILMKSINCQLPKSRLQFDSLKS